MIKNHHILFFYRIRTFPREKIILLAIKNKTNSRKRTLSPANRPIETEYP